MSELETSLAINAVLGVLLLVLMRWRRADDTARLIDADHALATFRIHFPDANGTVTLAADGLGALIDGGEEGVGLVQRHARRWNARMLGCGDLREVQVIADGLDLTLADFGWPRAIMVLAGKERDLWFRRLNALKAGTPTVQHA